MARHVIHTCDNCGKPITPSNQAIAKTYLTPITDGDTRVDHSSYTGHMTYGECCKEEVVTKNWRRRMTRQEYNNGKARGKFRPTNSVGKGTGRTARKAK